ncbi:uncharacterized protein RHOBADRAFT_45450 [Rhodotorula graminis WP1]|uniref:Uncharacterized protein n=1 Tax=Rhodotorula graminis (strain WP1) TaxID=578459 RepID=A0A0P9F1K4_RHOGW|nr:uncharacterized protein RHOBADRAFT_45450 [Rhodotorula graminis WP1]KPV73487.1 hypothetical protein RHOBADRAFT_45450 [Rhodotorula graminis WP1]
MAAQQRKARAAPADAHTAPAAASAGLHAASSAPAPAARAPPRTDDDESATDDDEPSSDKLKVDKRPLSTDEEAAGRQLYSHLVLRRDKAALEPLVRRPALRRLVASIDLAVLVAEDARERKQEDERERKKKLREDKERREKEREEQEQVGMDVYGQGGKGGVGRRSDEKQAAEAQKAADEEAAAEAKAVEDKAAEDKLVAEHIETILADVPNVKAVRAVSCDELVHVLLSQSTIRVERLDIQLVVGDLLLQCAPALVDLHDLRCDDIDDNADLPVLRNLTTLHVRSYCDAATFLLMVAPVRDQLVDLAFPVSSRIQPFNLGSFLKVKHFRLRIQNEPFPRATRPESSASSWVPHGLPHVEHLYLEGTLKFRTWDDRISSNPVHLPPRTADILLSLPRGHLRPEALGTLALGGEVGRGLCALLRGSENAYTALGAALKAAGIEVTTVR